MSAHKNKKNISERSVERICRYREILLELQKAGKEYIFSHELALEVKVSPAQVRRDLMLFSMRGIPQQGYLIPNFISEINELIDAKEVQNVLLVGVGNLGRAILSYFISKRPKLSVVAAFDVDEQKVNRVLSGCECFHLNDIANVIREKHIRVAIITVPHQEAQKVANILVKNNIRGILNFSPVHLNVPSEVFLENLDITTSLEKTIYFSRSK